jgi:hypothetical protein
MKKFKVNIVAVTWITIYAIASIIFGFLMIQIWNVVKCLVNG